MVKLFERCLNATYIHTAESGDYAIEVEGDTIYLLFEWSDGKEDWLNNFAFPVKPYKGMDATWFCHGGFLKVWKAMRDDIEGSIAEILSIYGGQISKIYCIGYSHGAAIAVLATEDMEWLYGEKYTVQGFGFGTPRVLWGIVPKAVKTRLKHFISIRNIPDIVTHVPPMIFGYRNVNLNKIGKFGKYGLIKAHYASAYTTELANISQGEG